MTMTVDTVTIAPKGTHGAPTGPGTANPNTKAVIPQPETVTGSVEFAYPSAIIHTLFDWYPLDHLAGLSKPEANRASADFIKADVAHLVAVWGNRYTIYRPDEPSANVIRKVQRQAWALQNAERKLERMLRRALVERVEATDAIRDGE